MLRDSSFAKERVPTMTTERLLVLHLLLACMFAMGCTAASKRRYLERMGKLAGEQASLESYGRALEHGQFDDLTVLFLDTPEARRSAAAAIADLDAKLAPFLESGASIEFVEPEVRDYDLMAEPPVADFSFHIGGRDGSGARHSFRATSRTELREVGRAASEADPDGIPVARMAIAAQEPFRIEHDSSPRPHFEDATARAGLKDRHRNQAIDKPCLIVQGMVTGSGAAAADFDRDGHVDLVAIDGQHSRLYLNRGDGTFEDRSEAWGLDAITGAGCVTADVDNDGDEDLYVLDNFGGTKLLRNDSNRFVDVTAEAGVGVSDSTFSACFVDIDRDGDLDLYVPVAGDYYWKLPMPPFSARNGDPDRLFVNDGRGHFTEEGRERGVDDVGWGLACGACDFDGDGDDDLYLANDFGPNSLFINDGTGHFRDVAIETGSSEPGYGMSVSWGDIDGDGRFDLYVCGIYTEFAPDFLDPDYPLPLAGRFFRGWVGRTLNRMCSGNALLRNGPDGTFAGVSKTWKVNEGGWAWAGMFLDYDNDGDLDIYSPNGCYSGPSREDLELRFWALSSLIWGNHEMERWLLRINDRSLHGRERNRLFEQRGPGRFAEVGWLNGVDAIENARGCVLADFDDDGYIDIYLRNLDAEARYFHNTGGTHHWIRVQLEGTRSNRDAVGSVVRVTAGGRTQLRQVTAGEGFFSSHDKRVLVGLGDSTAADIEVRWPSGLVQRFGGLAADTSYRLTENTDAAVRIVHPPTAQRR